MWACKAKKEVPASFPDDVLDYRSASPDVAKYAGDSLVAIDYHAMMENCQPAYLRVNVHWFLDDDCSLQLNNPNLPKATRDNIYELTQEMIFEANDMWVNIADNKYYRAKEAPIPSKSVCMPLQYVLDEVYVHCDAKAQKTRVGFRKFYPYNIDDDQVMNIFVSNVKGSTSGFAGGHGHMLVVENMNAGLFNHEMGHNFDLRHAYANESANAQTSNGCMDVYIPEPFKWDKDGDGKYEVNNRRGNCWDHLPGGDKNKNGKGDYCEGKYKANPHPCCDWSRQDNNIMSNSAWASNPRYVAITPCQIEVVMNNIAEHKLHFIEQVGGCPPPAPVIGILPTPLNDGPCSSCLHLEASQSLDTYRIAILQGVDTLFTTPELHTAPPALCLDASSSHPDWYRNLNQNETYSLLLTGRNTCGNQRSTTKRFMLADGCVREVKN